MTASILECLQVSRSFRIGGGLLQPARLLRAVSDVSVAVRRGEVLAVVGESGCGKTTLARMLLGLLPPSQGLIHYDGRPIANVGRQQVAANVQPVFQDPYSSLNPRKTLSEIIGLPLLVHKRGSLQERRRRVEEIMAQVGLPPHLIHAYPSQLSGGQRQRVAIARALAISPAVVVLDEPTSALDVSVQAQILNLLLELRRRLNLTYIFISHDLAIVEHMADRVAVMYLGRIVEMGQTENIFDSPRHPYTQSLLASILTPDANLGIPDASILGDFPDPLDPPSGCHFHPRCPSRLPHCQTTRPLGIVENRRQVECHLYEG